MTVANRGEKVEFLSNGKDVIIAMSNSMFLLKDVLLESIDMNYNIDHLDVTTLRKSYREFVTGMTTTQLNLQLKVCGAVEISNKVNLTDFKMASSMTIRELFKVINKKLKKRENK